MFQDYIFQPLKKLVHNTLSNQEIEKIDLTLILDKYINRFYGYSLLRDDVFLMLAISIIIKKRMRKLKQQIIEAKEILFNNQIKSNENNNNPIIRKRKVQRQRKEQIVVDNQLIKLPNYLQQNQNSQLAKEESISLPNSQQPSFNSQQQQYMKIEEEIEEQPEQIFVQDFREVLKEHNKMMEMQQDENQYQTEIKNTKIQFNIYQQLIDQLELNLDSQSSCNEDCDTRKNTRKKVKVQMDNGLKKKKILNYKSQFLDIEDEELYLLNKLEAYLIEEYKQDHEDQLSNQDDMLKQIFNCLNDESIQNQLLSMISILNPEEKFMNYSCDSNNKSNISVKSILQSKNHSEDSIKSLRRIQFIEEQQLEEIQEETSNHFNTTLFQDKSIYDKAIHFYHILCDAAQLTNITITQQNVDRFGPISIKYK